MKIDDPEFKRYNHSLYSPIFILPTVCDLIGSTLAGTDSVRQSLTRFLIDGS
jgi:hypothetical protein